MMKLKDRTGEDIERERLADRLLERSAVAALKGDLPFSSGYVAVKVENGQVILDGELEWMYQRERAERAVRRVSGLTPVVSRITVRPSASRSEIEARLEAACDERNMSSTPR